MPRAEDDSEFEAWYRDNYRRVVAATRLATGDRALAEEVVDEAFARAFERWSRVRVMESPTGWTCVVARNALRAAHRAERRLTNAMRRSFSATVDLPPDMAIDVWDAVVRLPRRQREVVALRYLAALSEREVAQTLGIAPGTVARALHDARQTLAHALREVTPMEEDHNG
jgi:RNA polymerase sigma-70 factor (ECF subfamily)